MYSTVSNKPNNKYKYSIVIPAAGIGSRMNTYGVKSLIKLKKKETVLSRQIEIINKVFKQYEIILVGGYQFDRLQSLKHNIKLVENHNYKFNNVGASIALGLDKVSTNRVVIIYGDLVFNQATLSVPLDEDSMLVISPKMKDEEVGCIVDGHYVEEMYYTAPLKWAQILYLTGKELDIYRNIVNNPANYHLFGFEAINKTLEEGGKIKAHIAKRSRVIDIDTSKDLSKAKLIS